MLASASDMLQVLRDDENLLPLYEVLAAAVDGSKYDDKGKLTEKSLVDAQMALLARVRASTSTRTARRSARTRSTRTRCSRTCPASS